MERQELVALLDGLTWYRAGKWGSVVLATIEFSPHIKFEIKHHNHLDPRAKGFVDRWNAAFEIHGNTSGVTLDSPDQVKTYLLSQYGKLAKYLDLIAKRQALEERIRPLQKKSHTYGDKIFELAKSL